jgi:hypothetical protein
LFRVGQQIDAFIPARDAGDKAESQNSENAEESAAE